MIQHYGPRLSLALSAITFAIGLNAQNFVIAQPQISSCSGVLYDSGGTLGIGYSNNENFTSTICGDQPEYAVGLTFNTFDLDQSGTDDQLAIYDGNSTNAPLIGTYFATDLLGLTVSATANNASGCLTLVFTSSASGTGVFSAAISCSGTCPAPTASFTTPQGDLTQLCTNGTISVDGSASAAAPGRSIVQWVWDLGLNGVQTTTTPIAEFTMGIGGVHRIILNVVDNLGCESAAGDTSVVLVSPVPDFSGTIVPALACEGPPLELIAVATQAPMVGNPQGCSNQDNGVGLPDQSITTSTLAVNAGNTNITSLSQLGDICIEMEHSFMSDIALTVTCPSGISVLLHNRGGGSTFLGEPNQSDAEPIIPGTCYQYCFGPDPDYGTLAQSIATGITPHVVTLPGGTTIAPGRYASVSALELLLGCPMSGTWTLTSSDQAGGDNGFLCGWCISFGNGPDSSFVDQGPILGTSADSSFWSAPAVNDPLEPGTAVYDPQEGIQPFSYTVVDSYGCTYDTTFVVQVGVPPGVMIEELPDLGLVCANATEQVTYQWSYQGIDVVGAAGSCFTPPGMGAVGVTVTTPEGCSGEALIISTGVSPSAGLPYGPAIQVFPIPNDGTFTVFVDGLGVRSASLRLLDMTGRAVHEQRIALGTARTIVPVSAALAPGAYFVQLTTADLTLSQRIVVR